jgi:hypothetical protein
MRFGKSEKFQFKSIILWKFNSEFKTHVPRHVSDIKRTPKKDINQKTSRQWIKKRNRTICFQIVNFKDPQFEKHIGCNMQII